MLMITSTKTFIKLKQLSSFAVNIGQQHQFSRRYDLLKRIKLNYQNDYYNSKTVIFISSFSLTIILMTMD